MGEFSGDGMYNPKTGKWNPSRDDFRYDSSNSATGMDFATAGIGIRRFGIGSKPPAIIRGLNKGAELEYKGAKGIYRGATKVRAWKRKIDQKIENKLKPDGKATPYGKNNRQKFVDTGKRVGRILNSKKGRASISVGTILGLGQANSPETSNSNENGWVIRKNKKRRIGFS